METELESNSRNVIPEVLHKQYLEDKRKEDHREMTETVASKELASEMMKSASGNENETLQKCVDLLNNQNGK